MARNERERDIDQLPWTRPGFVLAGLVVVLALACGLYLAFGGRGHHAAASSPAAPAPTAVPTTRSPAARSTSPTKRASAGCNVPPGPQAVPQVAPTDITWQLWRGVALPSSTSAGPAGAHGDIATCFAHSPLGALLAAVQLPYRVGYSPQWLAAVDAMTVPNAGRQALIRLVRSSIATQGTGFLYAPTPENQIQQVAAFQVVSYDGETAVIDLVERNESGTMGVAPFTVQWLDGDWRLVLAPTGALSGPAQPVSSTVGYIAWGGV
jgi:hypothetical protein